MSNDIKINRDSLFIAVLFLYICMLYSFYDYRVTITSFFIIVIGYYFITRKKGITIFVLWNVLLISWAFLSFLWSYDPGQSMIQTRILIEIAIISNLLVAFIDNRIKLEITYNLFIMAGFLYVIVIVLEFPLSTWGDGRLGSEGDFNPNRIGLYLTVSSLLALYKAQVHKKKYYFILFAIFLIVVLLTGSRKAFLMLIAGSLLLTYFNKGRDVSKKLLIILTGILALIIGIYMVISIPIFYDLIGARFESVLAELFGDGDRFSSAEVRFDMIEIGKMLFIEKPIIGYGIGSYSILSGFGTYSHNNYIELLVGVGVIGLFLYYVMLFYIVASLYKNRNYIVGNPLFVIVLLLVIIDFGLVSYNNFFYQLLIVLGFIANRVINLENSSKSNM